MFRNIFLAIESLVSKVSFAVERVVTLRNLAFAFLVVQLSGCVAIRQVMAIGDYRVEKFTRGRGGALMAAVCLLVGGFMVIATNNARGSEDIRNRRLIGLGLLFFGAWVMFIRIYLNFYYQGRNTPYE